MAEIVENTTDTIEVIPGKPHILGIAGTWDSMTATLKWSDGATDVDIQAFTDDGDLRFRCPYPGTLKLVTGADASNAGSLVYSIIPEVQ